MPPSRIFTRRASKITEHRGGKIKVVASIEDLAVIGKVIKHLAPRELSAGAQRLKWVFEIEVCE